MHRIIAVRHGIGDSLEKGFCAVLWQIQACRVLVGSNAHIAHGKGDRFGNLPVEGAGNCLGIELAGCAIRTSVMGGRNAGVGQPFFRCVAAKEEAGDGRSHRIVFIETDETHFFQCGFGIGPAFRAQQRSPQGFVQRSQTGVGHGLLIEPEEPRLSPALRQAQPLIACHAAF